MKRRKKLQTEYLGLTFETPFILASAPPTANAEMILRAFEQGWAGAVVKTLIREPVHNVCNRFAALRLQRNIIAFQNFELVSEKSSDEWFRDISRLKREFPHKPIISSIMGDALRPDDWIELALGSQEAGADLLELNFSCPHGYPEKGKGSAIGQNAEYVQLILSWLKDPRITLPIVPKLTAAVSDISHIGEVAARAGANGLSAINTVPSLMGFDLKTLSPKPAVSGLSTTGGYSGIGIKPIALRCVYELAKSPGLPIMASGGISSGFDAAEFILLGAPLLQICTAVMLGGYGIIGKLERDLSEFMAWHNFERIDDFRGKGLASLTDHAKLDRSYKLRARINDQTCTSCKRCLVSCRDAGYQAIGADGRSIYVDQTRCSGCGLCQLVCPSGSISLD